MRVFRAALFSLGIVSALWWWWGGSFWWQLVGWAIGVQFAWLLDAWQQQRRKK